MGEEIISYRAQARGAYGIVQASSKFCKFVINSALSRKKFSNFHILSNIIICITYVPVIERHILASRVREVRTLSRVA